MNRSKRRVRGAELKCEPISNLIDDCDDASCSSSSVSGWNMSHHPNCHGSLATANDGDRRESVESASRNRRSVKRPPRWVSTRFVWCTLLATITISEAFRHDAFVSRTGSAVLPLTSSSRARNIRSDRTELRQASVFGLGKRDGVLLRMSDTEVQSPSAGSDVDDEEEWRTVMAAFQMYKAAYGDLKVPSKFVVPGMAPWPEPAWKMKLGLRVAAIRSTGKYVQNNETRRKMLDDMGFLWRLRAPSPGNRLEGISFEQVYDALLMYRKEVQADGDKPEIPPNFVVPDCEPWPESTRGLPLGKIMPTVRGKVYLKQHPEAAEKLLSLGFKPEVKTAANDLRYQRVYDALVTYKELFGDLNVPQPFTVPEDGDDWPESTRGLRLGARVNAIRSQGTFVKSNPNRKDELDALGFAWEPPSSADGKKRGRKRKDEVEEPSPAGDDSPSGAPGLPPVSAFDTSRDPFFTGDQSNPPQWAFEGEDDEDMLEQEKANFAAPKSFNETLEEMADMAMSVGIMERWTPNKRVVKGARNKFVPWRNDDFGSDWVFSDVVEALGLYKSLYGNFDGIEEDEFVVPAPVEESLQLSPFELAALNGDVSDDIDDLDVPWGEDEDDESLESKFSVTASNDWPEHLAGMRLGQIVSRIRDGGLEVKHLPERKAELDEIGFDWGDPRQFVDVPFEKVMCALYAFYMIRGDTNVVADFTMPDEHPWPTVFSGYELGKAVVRLRQLQNSLEAYHPVKVTLLRMVDFQFFPELALPLDPDADEVDVEQMYVDTFGHPLYQISAVPLALPERMAANGPDGPSGKLGNWYNYEYVREYYERPGSFIGVADYMRDSGFHRLADEHEQKYGQSHYRQLVLLEEKLERQQIKEEDWNAAIERIQLEIEEEFENWSGPEDDLDELNKILARYGEHDPLIDEDTYYMSLLEAGAQPQQEISAPPPPPMPAPDVEEEDLEFNLSLAGEDE